MTAKMRLGFFCIQYFSQSKDETRAKHEQKWSALI